MNQQDTSETLNACKVTIGNYLSHYWPLCNGQMTDVVGGADMQQGASTIFVNDRFGNANSALNLNGGWTYLQSGIFFNTPGFTISAWIYPLNVGPWSRLVDFGNGLGIYNVLFSLDSNTNLLPRLCIKTDALGNEICAASSQSLVLGEWQFLVGTFDGTTISVYINGIIAGKTSVSSFLMPSSLIRTNNYIGQSNWATDGYSSTYLEELRFYNICLNPMQILSIMNETSGSIFCATTTVPTTMLTTTDSSTSLTTTDSSTILKTTDSTTILTVAYQTTFRTTTTIA